MFVKSLPAPIGFVKEMLVVANDLTMREVQIHSGALYFRPKYNRRRDALGLIRRLSNRMRTTGLIHPERYFNYSTFDINQDRLGQLIDLRGWPEVTRNILSIKMDLRQDNDGWFVEMEITCDEHDDM